MGDKRLVVRLNKWDDGEIALRGALLYLRGSEIAPSDAEEAKRKLSREMSAQSLDSMPEAHAPVDEVLPALQPSARVSMDLQSPRFHIAPNSHRDAPPLPEVAPR